MVITMALGAVQATQISFCLTPTPHLCDSTACRHPCDFRQQHIPWSSARPSVITRIMDINTDLCRAELGQCLEPWLTQLQGSSAYRVPSPAPGWGMGSSIGCWLFCLTPLLLFNIRNEHSYHCDVYLILSGFVFLRQGFPVWPWLSWDFI